MPKLRKTVKGLALKNTQIWMNVDTKFIWFQATYSEILELLDARVNRLGGFFL